MLIAAGTQPNTVLAREEGVSLALDGKYFQACDENGAPVKPERHTREAEAGRRCCCTGAPTGAS